MNNQLNLKTFSFQELQTVKGLKKLDLHFLRYLHERDASACQCLKRYREGQSFDAVNMSHLLITVATYLEGFIADLFVIEASVDQLKASILQDDPIFVFKKHFVWPAARRHLKDIITSSFAHLDRWLSSKLSSHALNASDRELKIALYAQELLNHSNVRSGDMRRLIQWCVLAIRTPDGQSAVRHWVSFRLPVRLNYQNLVPTEKVGEGTTTWLQSRASDLRERDGFALTDSRMASREIQNEVHYCIYCHEKSGDFCSKGFPVKKGQKEKTLRVNPLGEWLTGCPLDEKISEMHLLRKEGLSIAALAMIMVDNPMCPATGHRICNDCMKACIYQKQTPVNIPQVETRILSDVLALPWGVEIYDLLTRWNPLRRLQYLPKPYNGLKVLVMGMGPAGFSLAHHLLMEGFAVVGMDGLKIEPLDDMLLKEPIRDFESLKEALDDRVMTGFGGVAEYGITVRWDKNFLKLIYISLLRRSCFKIFGSVRFGGTLKVDDVWRLGFHHLALALGAGLPRELHIENSLAPGMRQANDFLMSLQLMGAAKNSSLANLQIRLPAIIIGGGLTGVDAATELQAYYITQVEKVKWRYDCLVAAYGKALVRSRFCRSDLVILDEFLQHACLVQKERALAVRQKRLPHFISLIRAWGGVTIVYRRAMQESPAYRYNHEELKKALEEGIYYLEGLDPTTVVLDSSGMVSALRCQLRRLNEMGRWVAVSDEARELPARAILVATGAKPNVAYEYEHRGTFHREGTHYVSYRLVDRELQRCHLGEHVKSSANTGFFTSYHRGGRYVSFLGDTHPVFQGSVVKAIASAQQAYPAIVSALKTSMEKDNHFRDYQRFSNKMNAYFHSKVIQVKRHHRQMVELIVYSPFSAQNFQPGQFYRLQNYETLASKIGETSLQTEALAALGIPNKKRGCLSFMIYEQGVSARLMAGFKPGVPISVMGPTGASSHLAREKSRIVLILGGVYAIAYLLAMGPALRQAGSRVLFVGLFDDLADVYCRQAVESWSEVSLWRVNETIEEWVLVLSGLSIFPVSAIDRVVVIGDHRLISDVRASKALRALLSPEVQFTASVYGPMQCMMKGICAQCLQWQVNPETGRRTKAVYACSWQHQPMEKIDVHNIGERLVQNRCQEQLSSLWLDYLLDRSPVKRTA